MTNTYCKEEINTTFVPNKPPFFDMDPKDMHIRLKVLKFPNGNVANIDQRKIKHTLPRIMDSTNDTVTVTILNKLSSPFLKFDNETRTFTIDTSMMTLKDVGKHRVDLTLSDNGIPYNMTNNYLFYIHVSAGDVKHKKPKSVEPVIKKWYPGYCSARIASISPYGRLVVKFNDTMFTKLNLSHLNSSSMDIYVNAALNRDKEDDFKKRDISIKNWTL